MKKTLANMAWLIVFVMLCGCTAVQRTIGTQPTVENIFVPPTSTGAPISPDATESNPPNANTPTKGGSMSWNFVGEEKDENGYDYLIYSGGQMHLPIHVIGSGIVAEHGIGILLFVGGKPQAYRTSENEEYQYVHSFTTDTYPALENGKLVIDTELIFTPVAGEAGTYVPCYMISIGDPDYSYENSSGSPGFKLTSSEMHIATKLKMHSDPPKAEVLPVEDRLTGFVSSTVETTKQEIYGWSDDDMMKYTRHKMYVNDRDLNFTNAVWDVTADKENTIRFEIYGSPYIHYALVIFMDNQPISLAEEDIIKVSIENGRKTIVTANLDMSDFDGESHVYCVLVPLNKDEYIGQGIRAGLIVSRYCFLLGDPYPY